MQAQTRALQQQGFERIQALWPLPKRLRCHRLAVRGRQFESFAGGSWSWHRPGGPTSPPSAGCRRQTGIDVLGASLFGSCRNRRDALGSADVLSR